MFFVLKKKKILFYSAVAFLVICCYSFFEFVDFNNKDIIKTDNNINDISDELSPGETLAVSGSNDYFIQSKTDKEIVRSKAAELLRNTIDNENSSPDARKAAESAIIAMATDMDKEAKIESILSAKGYSENVVFISDDVVTITVKSKDLSNEDTAKINDIASEISGNNNIKIVEVQ